MKKRIEHTTLKAGLIFAGFGALIYISNRLIPKMADDYAFSFIWDGKTNGNLAYGKHRYKRVRTMKDLAASQIAQNSFIQKGFTDEVDALYTRLSNCPVPSTPVYGRTPIFTCGGTACGCGCAGTL